MVSGAVDPTMDRSSEQLLGGCSSAAASESLIAETAAVLADADAVMGAGVTTRIGRFKFFLDGQRWEWSDAVARMHGYEPGAVDPTTELLLQHKHPDDRQRVAAVLERVMSGEPFSSRHRIVDTRGHTHWVLVVGDAMCDALGAVSGTTGFYIDDTEVLQHEVSAAVSEVTDSRASIEQAKGVLMTTCGISSHRAFELLVWRSQETNVKVRDLAMNFINALSGEISAETRSQVDRAFLTC